MGTLQIPAGPETGASAVARRLSETRADRRGFLARAAGLSLALPALGGLAIAANAQNPTPAGQPAPLGTAEAGYVGSNPDSPSTGDESPVPAAQVQPFALYDPVLPAVTAGTKDIRVVAKDATLLVADEVPYAGWTFDGTIPGRTLRVVEGDQVNFTLAIDPAASTAHSLDFHSAKTPPEKNYKTILPGEEFSWSFVAKVPGCFMYHCGTPPVLMHIGAGMYGAMIVDPKEGWPPAQELIFVQSEFYLGDGGNGVMVPDYEKMAGMVDISYVVFNGYANQYVAHPIAIKVGQPVRIFLMNAGPNIWSSFHVVGAIFDRACVNANPRNELFGLQSITVGPGDGACVEFTVEEPGEYVAVNHAFGHASHGAIAILHAA